MNVRTSLVLAAAALALLLARPSRAESKPTDDELRASLRAAEEGFAKAFADRDREKFFAYVDDDAMFLSGNLRGKKAVEEDWSKFFESEEAPLSWGPTRYEINPSGTMGMTTGPVRSPDGTWVGSFMSVWRAQPDGTWRVIFDGGPDCPPRAQEQ